MNWGNSNNNNNDGPWGSGGKNPWSGGNSNNRDIEESIRKAKELLKKFGSIAELVVASQNELCEVEGIGKVTASNIHKAFNQEREVKY